MKKIILIGVLLILAVSFSGCKTDQAPEVESPKADVQETDLTNTEVEDAEEDLSAETETAIEQSEKLIADCRSLNKEWSLFAHKHTTLTFCYKNEWGTPEFKETDISPSVRYGTKYYITFPNAINGIPQINYQTLEYEVTGDRGGPADLDWSKVDLEKDLTELSDAFLLNVEEEDTPVVERMEIVGQEGLKVYRHFISPYENMELNVIDYYVPKVEIMENVFDLNIKSSVENEDDIETMVESIQNYDW